MAPEGVAWRWWARVVQLVELRWCDSEDSVDALFLIRWQEVFGNSEYCNGYPEVVQSECGPGGCRLLLTERIIWALGTRPQQTWLIQISRIWGLHAGDKRSSQIGPWSTSPTLWLLALVFPKIVLSSYSLRQRMIIEGNDAAIYYRIVDMFKPAEREYIIETVW